MAHLGIDFDATQVEPSKPRQVVQPGWYKAYIEASDVKPTKKAATAQQYGEPGADDKLLALTFKIIEGDREGSLIFNNLNLINSNPIAQEIAAKDFSAICHAVGKLRVKDSSELHHKPMLIKVDVEKKEGYDARNIIKGYKAIGESTGEPVAVASGAPKPAARPAWSTK